MRMFRFTRSAAFPLALLLLSVLPRTARAGDSVWTAIGPYGGTLQSVVFHPSQAGTLWVGTQTNGVFVSTDGGVTWAAMNQGLPSDFYRGVTFLDVSAAGPQTTLYVHLSGVGLFRSVEGGRWERRSPDTGLPLGITPLAADPARPDVLWGRSSYESYGIAASGDGGATWSLVHELPGGSGGSTPNGFLFAPGNPSTIYAGLSSIEGSPRGVLRSRDGGVTWEAANNGLELPEGYITVQMEVAADTGALFASVERYVEGVLESRVYRSVNGGDHWTLVLPAGGSVTAGAGGLVLARGGYRSLDGGLTWSPLSLPDEFLYALEAHPASPGIAFLALSSRGLFRSTDAGTSWRASNQGILAASSLDLVVDPLDPGTFYASLTGSGLFKTTQGGGVWERLYPQGDEADFEFREIDELAAVPAGGETTLHGVEGRSRLLRTEDGGASWADLGNPGSFSILALAVDPKDPLSLYAGSDLSRCPARKSMDGGETWRCLGVGKTLDLVVHPSRPADVWAASRTVYRSTDRGRTWKAAGRGLPVDIVYTLAAAPSNPDVVYAGTWNGVYKTSDGGRSWAPVNTGLPAHSFVPSVAVHPRNPSIVYAGVTLGGGLDGPGVYRSTDGGRRWRKLTAGMPVGFSGPVVIDPHDPRTVYAGTQSRGFHAITLRR